MRISRTRVLSLSTAIAAIALGAASTPALAAGPSLSISGPAAVAVDPNPSGPGNAGSYVQYNLKLDPADTQAGWTVVQIDTSGLKGIAEIQAPSNCTTSGTTLSCPWVPLYQGQAQLSLQLTAAKGGTVGATGTLHANAHLQSGNVTSPTVDTKVTLGGTKLKGKEVPVNKNLKPGDTWTPDIEVTNQGQLPATQLVFTFFGGTGLDFVPRFSNCEYGTSPNGFPVVICTVNSTLAPGETVRLDPVQFKVNSSAYYSYEDVNIYPHDPGPDSWLRKGFHYTPGPAGAPRLTVGKPETAPQPTSGPDLDPNGGMIGLAATVANTADFAAFGAWAPGQSGKQGKLTVGMTNSGPATIYWRSGDDPADVAVTLPKQVKVVTAPDKCRLDNQFKSSTEARYDCQTTPWVPAGFKTSFDFTLQVDPAAKASAVVTLINELGTDSGMAWDPNKNNNTVTLALGCQTTGGVPTGGSSTPPSTTPPGPPASATPSPRPTTSTTSTPTATPSATASSTAGGLAFTGAEGIGTMVGLGLGAVALGGGVMVYAARRRKAGAHQ